jgi:hypothetical protein
VPNDRLERLKKLKGGMSTVADIPPVEPVANQPSPYDSRAEEYARQAAELEAQAAQPYPEPKGTKEYLVQAARAAMENFGRLGAPGGYYGQEAQRQEKFAGENTQRLAKAKEFRGLAQGERESGATAQYRADTLSETSRGHAIQEAAARKPVASEISPGATQILRKPDTGEQIGQPYTAPAAPVKPEAITNLTKDTIKYRGVATDVYTGLDPNDKTHFGRYFLPTKDGLVDITGEQSHFEHPGQGANLFNLNNPPSPPETVKWIAEQVRRDPNNWSLAAGNETLQNQVRAELQSGGTPLNPRTAGERKDEGNLSVMLEDIGTLNRLADTHKDAIGPVQGRVAALKRATVGTGDPEVNELFRISDNLADQLLRARSGAQINENEYSRLRSIVPNPRGPEDKFFSDLQGFRSEMERIIQERFQAPQSGGAPPPPAQPGGWKVIGVK